MGSAESRSAIRFHTVVRSCCAGEVVLRRRELGAELLGGMAGRHRQVGRDVADGPVLAQGGGLPGIVARRREGRVQTSDSAVTSGITSSSTNLPSGPADVGEQQ